MFGLKLRHYGEFVLHSRILYPKNFEFRFLSSVSSASPTNSDNNVLPGPPPIQVGFTQWAGRGVFATRKIGAGDLIHTANPILVHPSLSSIPTICYFCLRRPSGSEALDDAGKKFCSRECREKAKGFYDVERRGDWSAFDDYCRSYGFKYPLLVKRLACTVISGASPVDTLDILQPAETLNSQLEEGYDLLWDAFKKARFGEDDISFLTKQWYSGVLARIRINAFRVELATSSYEDLLASAAAAVEAEASVGNALYMLPSFYNHDCDPNTHIIWIDNANARVKTLRDVDEGEELRICYIDASMSQESRQHVLLHGFGFRCSCLRCQYGD